MYVKEDTVENETYQRGLIITDDIAIDPILDFNLYTNAIVNIVRNSYPKFTIGLFGDWGTGKTTLMNSIYKILDIGKSFVLVRFETWRYEREEQFALIPLLKTIAFALPDEKKFQALKQKLKRGAIGFLKKTPDIVTSMISKYVSEEAGTITKSAIDSFRKEFNSKFELLAEVDRDTLYFDGFEDIRNEIREIRQNNSAFRIVVFIDDLDRCSPRKLLLYSIINTLMARNIVDDVRPIFTIMVYSVLAAECLGFSSSSIDIIRQKSFRL